MLKIEVCVPNGAQYEAASAALAADAAFTVVRASVTCGTHTCIATAGDSFGGMSVAGSSSAVHPHLSSYTPFEFVQRRVKDAIVEEHGGELPVGCAVVVQTQHPRHRLLLYAPTARVPDGSPLPPDTIAPFLACRAVLLRAAELARRRTISGISLPLFAGFVGEVPVARVCAQMLHAHASLTQIPAFMRAEGEAAAALENHRRLLGGCADDDDDDEEEDDDADEEDASENEEDYEPDAALRMHGPKAHRLS